MQSLSWESLAIGETDHYSEKHSPQAFSTLNMFIFYKQIILNKFESDNNKNT